MADIFSVNTIFFNIFDYQVSYLEFVGTVLYFASVWLIARRNMWTWPVGIISVILYMFLFYQFALYSDVFEQGYYLIASTYGWWAWSRGSRNEKVATGFSKPRVIALWAAVTLLIGVALGLTMSQVHDWLPLVFPEPAALPMLDAITTVMSLSAMWLLTLRRAESWVYWIIVDIAAIYVYFTKGIAFVGLQYIALTLMAVYGFMSWRQNVKKVVA